MGINATLFQRIPHGTLTEREREELPQQMDAVIPGHGAGFIRPYCQEDREWLEPVRWLSDVTIREEDLLFWPCIDCGRLYDFHYARGKLPLVLMATWWMEDHIPEGEVLYVGATEGRTLTDRAKGALMYHYCRYGYRWYTSNAILKMKGLSAGSRTADDEEDIATMCEAFRDDFGGTQVDITELDASWQEVPWRGLAYHLARLDGAIDVRTDAWPLPVSELTRADLGPLLNSFHCPNRLYGAQLAYELDDCSDRRAAAIVEPLLASDGEKLRLKALEVAYGIDGISSDVKDEVLAGLIASESEWVRKQAMRLSGRVR